ncbi:hypothetical protein ACWDF6_48270, partial [Streptomyces sp. NPDC001155]
ALHVLPVVVQRALHRLAHLLLRRQVHDPADLADGLLRSAADSGLCLDSHADAGVVILGSCADAGSERGDDVRYDATVQGELLPRWDRTLALAGAAETAGADVVVKVRDGSAGQRWVTDAPSASPGSLSTAGTDGPSARPTRPPAKDA